LISSRRLIFVSNKLYLLVTSSNLSEAVNDFSKLVAYIMRNIIVFSIIIINYAIIKKRKAALVRLFKLMPRYCWLYP